MTDDLIAWLREQLDEDVRGVREWIEPRPDGLLSSQLRAVHELTDRVGAQRMLAEVDAKRRILDVYRADVIDVSVVPGRPEWMHGAVPVEAHTVLRLLALPYADREGYREEWKP